MSDYAKLIDNKLIYAGSSISGKDKNGSYFIVNPTKAQLKEKGYKQVICEQKPEYDIENEKLIEEYFENENNIVINYVIITLSISEHNQIIQQEIDNEESKMTQRYIRNAALKDEFAINKLQEIENNIAILRTKLK